MGTQTCSFAYVFSVATSTLPWESWPTKPKVFTMWPFTEKYLPTPGLNNQNLLLYKVRSSKCETPGLTDLTGQQNHQTSDSSLISTMQPHCISFIPRSAPLRVARWLQWLQASHYDLDSVCKRKYSIWYVFFKSGETYLSVVYVVQFLSRVWLFVTPWTTAHQASLSFPISQS